MNDLTTCNYYGISYIKDKIADDEYLNNVYKDMNPNNYDKWRREQFKFWKNEKIS